MLLVLIAITSSTAACGESAARGLTAPSPSSQSAAPVVVFDQGHFSPHRLSTTYAPLARLASGEGWTVQTNLVPFVPDSLRRARVLVIVNALAPENVSPGTWRLPTPSAFTPDEIDAVRAWVQGGGGLLLIADHMPFPGAAELMAAAFGARFTNGFAFDARQLPQPKTCLAEAEVHVFRRADGTLGDHPITEGVDQVATFTGSAFEMDAAPLLTFNATSVSLQPDTAWVFGPATPRIPVAGWHQGAAAQFGEGRVAIFGEAAMFTEQTCGANVPMGMTSPLARQNSRLLVNVINWLGGRTG